MQRRPPPPRGQYYYHHIYNVSHTRNDDVFLSASLLRARSPSVRPSPSVALALWPTLAGRPPSNTRQRVTTETRLRLPAPGNVEWPWISHRFRYTHTRATHYAATSLIQRRYIVFGSVVRIIYVCIIVIVMIIFSFQKQWTRSRNTCATSRCIHGQAPPGPQWHKNNNYTNAETRVVCVWCSSSRFGEYGGGKKGVRKRRFTDVGDTALHQDRRRWREHKFKHLGR